MGKRSNMQKYLVGILGLALVGVVGFMLMGGTLPFSVVPNDGGSQQPVTPPNNVPISDYQCESSATLSIPYGIFDSTPGNEGTNLNADYNLVIYRNGMYSTTALATTAISASPNDVVTLYAQDRDATHDVYGFSDSFKVGCTSAPVSVTRGMQDGALTVVVYSESTGTDVANTLGALEAVGAGGTADGKINIRQTTKDARWGTTEGGPRFAVTFDYNSLTFQAPEVVSTTKGTIAKLSGNPCGHVANGIDGNATLSVTYEISGDILTNINSVDVYFQADALTATTDPLTGAGSIAVTVSDLEMYNTSSGQWVTDYRNCDTTADLGESNATDQYYTS